MTETGVVGDEGRRPGGCDQERVELLAVHVGAYATGLLCPREQPAHRLLQRVGHVPALSGVATGRTEGGGDRELGRCVGDGVGEEVVEGTGRVVRFGRGVGTFAESGQAAYEYGLEQRGLRREVPEHGRDPDLRPPGHLLGRRRLAARAEHVVGDGQDPLAVRRRVPAAARRAVDIGVFTPYLLRSHHSA